MRGMHEVRSAPKEARDGGKKIPESEMKIEYARSGGSGGQNVNKLNTKAVITWRVASSSVFTEEEKQRILASSRVNKSGEIVLHCDEQRTQLQNKNTGIERLHQIVGEALVVEEERVPTKKGKGVKAREMNQRIIESKKKQARGKVDRYE